MNIKKILQEMAERDAAALLTEEDERFIEELVKNHPVREKPDGKSKKRDKVKKAKNKPSDD